MVSSRLSIVMNNLKKDRNTGIKQLMNSDHNLSDLEKQVVYETLEADERFLFGIRCWTVRMKGLLSSLPAVLVFTRSGIMILPVSPHVDYPFEKMYYSEIDDIRQKKRIFLDKLIFRSGKRSIGAVLDRKYPDINDNIADFIRNMLKEHQNA